MAVRVVAKTNEIMSATPNDGGPAFPNGPAGDVMCGEDGRQWHQYPPTTGMSLRDWFAGMALSSMTVSPEDSDEAIADHAYRIADAALKAREQ